MSEDATSAAQQFYDRWATAYDWLASATPVVGRVRERAAAALDLSPGDTVVEMGVGTGANLPCLRERVGPSGTVVGLDFTRGMLQRARERVEREGWSNVHLAQADATAPPLENDSIDAVLATFVVGMLEDPAAAVERWARLVGSGGTIGLVDLGRTDHSLWRPLNLPFRWVVRAGAPPGTAERGDGAPTDRLDRRLDAAHATVSAVCDGAGIERETHALGFARISVGTVASR